ncbi:MAG: dephospho-CoA kinase [Acetobacteraceae bacterium]|nr:dephospho-CoA kinase [Acetobacteraceae bacterium]
MRIIGLTGGIGMGKSTAAAAFRRACIPVFDADLSVHRMQAKGGRAVKVIEAAFPGTTKDGAVDRMALRHAVLGNREALTRLEHILHPMVEADERAFVNRARRAARHAVVLDIPLLFETKGEKRVDTVVVVSAPRAIQIHRVGLRRGMSKADVAAVIARQMPDREKRRRANLVVKTGLSRNHALRIVTRFIQTLRHDSHRLVRHGNNGTRPA